MKTEELRNGQTSEEIVEEKNKEAEERRKRVFEWLRSDQAEEVRTDHKRGGGFSVYGNTRIDTPMGPNDIVTWLKQFGFEHDMIIDGYRVVHQLPSQLKGYPEGFTFFIVNKPCAVPDFFGDIPPVTSEKDDIPY